MQAMTPESRREKPGRATGQGEMLPHGIALRQQRALAPIAKWVGRDALPERTQFVDARLRRIAGNQRTVDGADRNAGDPVGTKIGLGQCPIDPSLIRTERTTALDEERDALERRSRPLSAKPHRLMLERAAEVGPRRLSRVGNDSGGSINHRR
jgi:hypothetical protein